MNRSNDREPLQNQKQGVSKKLEFYPMFWVAFALQLVVTIAGRFNSLGIVVIGWLPVALVLVSSGLELDLPWWKIAVSALTSVLPLGCLLVLPYYLDAINSSDTSEKMQDKHRKSNANRSDNHKDTKEAGIIGPPPQQIKNAHDLVPSVVTYASDLLDTFKPQDLSIFFEWQRFITATGVFIAVWHMSPEYYHELSLIVRTDLKDAGGSLLADFECCADFCRRYFSQIPAEYGERWPDLLAAWVATDILKKPFKSIEELSLLRDICADVVKRFSGWWGEKPTHKELGAD